MDEIIKYSGRVECSQIIASLVSREITENEVKNAIKEMINQGCLSIGGRRARLSCQDILLLKSTKH